MITRNLTIALIISFGLHIIFMSAVLLKTPDDFGRIRSYTRVDFLGPILKKTAFDIMLENADPLMKTTYRYKDFIKQSGYLEVAAGRRTMNVSEFPEHLERNMETEIIGSISAAKAVPEFVLDLETETLISAEDFGYTIDSGFGEREVIYKPEEPTVTKGLYGDKETFNIIVKVLVGSSGTVRKTEPLTTTGYSEVDMLAAKYVKGWIFEPTEDTDSVEEWYDIDVVIGVWE